MQFPAAIYFALLSCTATGANLRELPASTNQLVTIVNGLDIPQTYNFKFLGDAFQGDQDISKYKSFCVPPAGPPPLECSFELQPKAKQVFEVSSSKAKQVSITVTVGKGMWPTGPCPTTNMELNFHGNLNAPDEDTIDVSYVNGQNYGVIVTNSKAGISIIDASSSKLSTMLKTPGIYPPGCDVCTPSNKKSAPIWPGCPATPYGGQMPASSCKPLVNGQPETPCQLSHPANSDYTLTFVEPVNI